MNLPKDTDSQQILSECQEYGEVLTLKYFKQLGSAVVVFDDVHSAIACKAALQNKYEMTFGEV